MSDNLLPCPFCGGAARDRSHTSCDCCGKPFTGIVECSACGAEVSHFDTAAEAIAAWNRRTGIAGMLSDGWIVELIEDEGRGYYARLRNIKTGAAQEGTGATIEEAVASAARGIG